MRFPAWLAAAHEARAADAVREATLNIGATRRVNHNYIGSHAHRSEPDLLSESHLLLLLLLLFLVVVVVAAVFVFVV